MRKYKQILLLAIFGVANFCYLSNALSVEKYFASNNENEDEMEIMLRTLEKERAELGKLKSEFKGTFEMTEEESEVPIKKEVEKVAKKKVYFKLNSLIENESDIVFANNILPLEYKNTTVSEGIHKIMQKWNF